MRSSVCTAAHRMRAGARVRVPRAWASRRGFRYIERSRGILRTKKALRQCEPIDTAVSSQDIVKDARDARNGRTCRTAQSMPPLVAVSADQELHTKLTARGVQLVQSVVGTVNSSAKETERFENRGFSRACGHGKANGIL